MRFDATSASCLSRRAGLDGREANVVPLTFGRARVNIGPVGDDWIEDGW